MKVYIGIDWSEKKHDVCFVDETGEVLRVLQINHTLEGFAQLDDARRSLGVEAAECVVGLETAHNLLVDYLWDQGYTQIFVLPPQAVKSAQGRFRQSGAKDDPWDARLIADMLRTDQKRYHAWQPDQPLTRQIRAEVRFVGQVAKQLVRGTNQLRSNLLRYYPAAVQLFSKLDGLVSLAFLQTYPTYQRAKALSYEECITFLREHQHTQKRSWPKIYAHLQEDWPQPKQEVEIIYSTLVVAQARILEQLAKARNDGLTRVTKLYLQHPDHHIYDSLPQAGVFLSPALLAKLGDDRNRFPNPAVLQAVAGTCPVTRRSGKHTYVYFRQACDRDFRNIVQQWARLTLTESPWAVAYYTAVRSRCQSDSEAVRRLANRWLEILWRLWTDRLTYQQDLHLKQHSLRKTTR